MGHYAQNERCEMAACNKGTLPHMHVLEEKNASHDFSSLIRIKNSYRIHSDKEPTFH